MIGERVTSKKRWGNILVSNIATSDALTNPASRSSYCLFLDPDAGKAPTHTWKHFFIETLGWDRFW